jgi:hypothetical protein
VFFLCISLLFSGSVDQIRVLSSAILPQEVAQLYSFDSGAAVPNLAGSGFSGVCHVYSPFYDTGASGLLVNLVCSLFVLAIPSRPFTNRLSLVWRRLCSLGRRSR